MTGPATIKPAAERSHGLRPLATVWHVVGTVLIVVWSVLCWFNRHLRYVATVAFSGLLATILLPHLASTGQHAVVVTRVTVGVLLLVPSVVAVMWSRWWPFSYETWVGGPVRRFRWARWAARSWDDLARECGLSTQRVETVKVTERVRTKDGTTYVRKPHEVRYWVPPNLTHVTTDGDVLRLEITTRTGQVVDELEAAVPAIASAARAVASRAVVVNAWTITAELVMRESLATPCLAAVPEPVSRKSFLAGEVDVSRVALGRCQDGSLWELPVMDRHTLVAGASGSGKGSILWGVVGNLAPAVPLDLVRLWGVDLKRGVEIGMGSGLFTRVATTPVEALPVLRKLLGVIDQRAARMVGTSRLHQPRPGDPLHVLVIDELAMLIAYSDPETRKEGVRLLSEILTQGRAFGVVVIACVQDPRKEIVTMRGLFTQTVALRLRSAEETRMVLDVASGIAPAHRISPSAQGTAWILDDSGTAERVRADYWPDRLIKQTAAAFPACVLDLDAVDSTEAAESSATDSAPHVQYRKPRKPRRTRTADGATTQDEVA